MSRRLLLLCALQSASAWVSPMRRPTQRVHHAVAEHPLHIQSPQSEASARRVATNRIVRTSTVLLVPAIAAGIFSYLSFGPLARGLRSIFGLEALYILSNDQGQFLQNFLGVIGILFSLLIGNTYSFCYQQQVMIYMAFFEEISVAKALLEQISLVCRGRPYYDAVLDNIERYVERDLRRVDLPPAVVLSSKPKDDPLEQIMWMTSVGTPSVVYDTVKWLRQARGQRLGAVQRKLPPLHFALLFVLAAFELSAFPLLSAGAAQTDGNGVLVVEAGIFALMAAAVVLTLGVVLQLWRPSGSAYSVDDALSVMLAGLADELADRRAGLAPRAATNLPAPPAFPY
ncbi:hypothetical protein CTAYLR_007760 [Chrysophaeum taylorii]|uniref:Uncharacterized protein n=1 Tax=Chrysophaeum taylorii TaxID=2483200 RepID=A0AAD7XSV9_9STRA|nr:hypothetical protein CTAYLR_007760 [Chrysophaeum taylorii]